MARKGRLNERRLTRRQVQALISSGARPRPDLSAQLEQTFATGYKERPLVYELEGNRYLYVFDELWGQGGKGDIYAADDFLGSCGGRLGFVTIKSTGAETLSAIGAITRRSSTD
jgi:hypothetical protein